jgi:hypothetical protein
MSEFKPINSQEQLDQIISKRVKGEKALREEVDNLRAHVASRDEEIAALRREHEHELAAIERGQRVSDLERQTRAMLAERGVEDEGRQERILRLLDLEDAAATQEHSTPLTSVEFQLSRLAQDVPELLAPREFHIGGGSGGSSTPVLTPEQPLLSEEDIAKMSPEEMAKPSIMGRVDEFLRGQR